MKKYALMAMMALSLGFVACDEPEDAPGKPQEYPQQSIMATDDIAVTSPEATASAVNFAQFAGEDASNLIPVLQFTKFQNFPEGYNLVCEMQYASNENFSDARQVATVFDPETKVVSAQVASWETAHIELFTKNPRPVEGWVRFYLYAVNGTTKVNLGPTANTVWNAHSIKVTPLPATVVVEEAYTLVADGQPIAMTATNPENVYDPPTFSAVVSVEEGQTVNVQIKSASGKVYGQGSAAGTLAEGGQPIAISEVGPQKVEVNMEDFTYNVSIAIETLYAYVASPKQGMALTTTDFVNYAGFVGLTNSFMLTNDNTTLSPKLKWGAGTEEDGKTVIPGALALGGPKIAVDPIGCYWLKVNLANLSYEADYIEYFEMVGGWDPNWADPIKMTPDAKYTKWTGKVNITNGTEFKFRSNSNWDNPNLGGTADNLIEHGDNITWNFGDGEFMVELDLTTVPYTFTATAIN